jgi:hypothetical protein
VGVELFIIQNRALAGLQMLKESQTSFSHKHKKIIMKT